MFSGVFLWVSSAQGLGLSPFLLSPQGIWDSLSHTRTEEKVRDSVGEMFSVWLVWEIKAALRQEMGLLSCFFFLKFIYL